MKKIITLIIAITLGGQLHAQTIGPDQLDQIKRLSRRNNHITKTYDGTVEKLVYSFRDIGGSLTSVIFKRDDGKRMLVKFYRWHGKFIKPYLVEGQKIKLTVKGDPLLLDIIIYKDQYFRELEFSIKAPISGIADLQEITSPLGTFNISQIDGEKAVWGLNPNQETLFNVQINRKERLDKLREMLIMENGDSLIISADTEYAQEIGNKVSYTKMVRDDNNPIYYKNPNVHYLYGGKETMELLVQYGVWQMNTNLLRNLELSMKELKAGVDGIVDKALFVSSNGEELELKFNSKDASQVKDLFESGAKRMVHFQPSMNKNQILAIEDGGELVRFSDNLSNSLAELYGTEVVSYSGKITRLNPVKGLDIYVPEALMAAQKEMDKEATGYSSLLIDNKTFLVIPSFTRISLGKDIKTGDDIEISGYLRNELPNEIQLSDYQIIYPKQITLGRKTYQVTDFFESRL